MAVNIPFNISFITGEYQGFMARSPITVNKSYNFSVELLPSVCSCHLILMSFIKTKFKTVSGNYYFQYSFPDGLAVQ